MVDLKDINIDQFDGILVFDKDTINEGSLADIMGGGPGDVRATSAVIGPKYDKGAYSDYLYYQDPKIYASWSFGKQLLGYLNGIGTGYSAEVADFGRYVTAKVTYSNPPTGKTASKTFLIVFDPDGKTGNVYNTSNRYRTFSGLSQASSYIKSCVSSLRNNTSQ